MANIVLQFDINGQKIQRFNIHNQPDDLAWLNTGDEIGFDLVESKDYFYARVSRKVYLINNNESLHIICVPINFDSASILNATLENFRMQYPDLVVDN
jgi:hypothetical protein